MIIGKGYCDGTTILISNGVRVKRRSSHVADERRAYNKPVSFAVQQDDQKRKRTNINKTQWNKKRTRQNTTKNIEQIDVINDRLKCSAMDEVGCS